MVTLGPISAAAFPSVLFSPHQLIEIASNSIENKENPQKCEEYLFKARNRAVLGKSARRPPRGRGHGQRPDAPPPLGHRRRRRPRPGKEAAHFNSWQATLSDSFAWGLISIIIYNN